MKLRRSFTAVLAAASMLMMGVLLTGCSGSEAAADNGAAQGYTTREEAVQAATKESQQVVREIEARDGKVVIVWKNTGEKSTVPFTLGLLEQDGDNWAMTNTASVTMTDKLSGKGSYPVSDPMITYDVTPDPDAPASANHANHEQTDDWCFHWTLVPELPA